LRYRITAPETTGPLSSTPASAEPRAEAVEQRVLAAQVRLLYKDSWTALPLGFVLALGFWLSFYLWTEQSSVLWWAAVVHSAQLLRLADTLAYRRAQQPEAGLDRWLRRSVTTIGLTSLAWGLVPWFVLTQSGSVGTAANSLSPTVLALLALMGLAAGGVPTVLANRAALFAWLLPLSLPLPVALLWYGVPLAPLLAFLILGFLVFQLVFGLRHHKMIVQALGTRYAHAGLTERLRQQMDLAAQANRDKSRFLAAASHDLRQPMHALSLFSGALDKRLAGSELQPLMQNLNECVTSLDRSFNAMLDVSKLDAGVVEPTLHTFPIRDVFRRLHMHFAGQAEAAGLQLRFKPGGKKITTDPQLFERVMGNIIQNAIKYTREGGIVVVARTANRNKPGGEQVNVEVWDTGSGILATELPRVFDEFYQVDNPQHDRNRGLGMGLAIVKRLVLLLGHPLEVQSRPSRGTMFRISVPAQDLEALEGMDVGAETVPSPMGDARTLLVIDDEEKIRHSTAMLLEQWGYQVLVAGSGPEACKVVSEHGEQVHAIVSDLRLRNGDNGLKAIRAVRNVIGQDLPAVLVTGDTSKEQIQRAHDSGHLVLFKPVRPKELYAVLRQLS
jgi:two-component system, sensor histidine kinase